MIFLTPTPRSPLRYPERDVAASGCLGWPVFARRPQSRSHLVTKFNNRLQKQHFSKTQGDVSMKSRRSWLIGLALGAVLSFGAPSAYGQVSGHEGNGDPKVLNTWNGGPRMFSYQGLVKDLAGKPIAD